MKEIMSQQDVASHWELITNTLKLFNFDEATPERVQKLRTRLGLEEPEASRVKETIKQTSFVKEIDGYVVWVHTSYDAQKEAFTKSGRIWIVISKPTKKGYQSLYTTFFYRRGEFSVKVADQIEFVVHALVHRPQGNDGKLLELRETSPGVFVWWSKKQKERKSFFHSIPLEMQGRIVKRENCKGYYENITRPAKGIVVRARDERKTWNVRKPQNAV